MRSKVFHRGNMQRRGYQPSDKLKNPPPKTALELAREQWFNDHPDGKGTVTVLRKHGDIVDSSSRIKKGTE